ncbi:flavin-containing monooxygenase [Aspergillus undulatus]|uniref:flavin-containing monooxygenase n=1 Tax=Aspergillus undulatus TaxID=1810928 RepID=UPI003CCD3774
MTDKLRIDAYPGNKDYTNAAVVIIGAGISGMCMAIDLIKRNKCHNFVILEKSSGVGGTWHDNKYPGCCCDVTSILYSYSFEQYTRWSRQFPGQEELLIYLTQVAEKYGLYKYIRFNSEVKEARWDEKEMKWKVSVEVSGDKDNQFTRSYVLSADFLTSAVGQLNFPREPDIPGLKDFRGKMMHSARWDWTYNFENKRIAIIGNGATAAQIVPEVAKVASHLTVFQRTPNWLVPRFDTAITPLQQALLTYIPPLRIRKRSTTMDFREDFHEVIRDSNSKTAQFVRDITSKRLRTQLADKPELWEKLTPNYAPGCKRLILSDDYYPALNRENVDLETRRISRVTETGVEVEDGTQKEYDFIILATGFRTVEFMCPIQIHGSNGRPLADIWKDGASALHGVTVEDLPNFGMFYGPNTNLGHSSIILMIEAQSQYLNAIVGKVLRARAQGKTLAMKPDVDALRKFNQELQAELARSSFADSNCSSWYKTEEGKITNNWSGTVVDYQRNLSKLRWEDYVVEGTAKDIVKPQEVTHLGRVHEETYISNRSLALTAGSVLAVVGGVLLRGSNLLRAR